MRHNRKVAEVAQWTFKGDVNVNWPWVWFIVLEKRNYFFKNTDAAMAIYMCTHVRGPEHHANCQNNGLRGVIGWGEENKLPRRAPLYILRFWLYFSRGRITMSCLWYPNSKPELWSNGTGEFHTGKWGGGGGFLGVISNGHGVERGLRKRNIGKE